MYLNYFKFKVESITCPKCSWEGLGSELKYGEYSESGFIVDMDCPKCHETIGYFQFPLKEEVEKWKLENPGVETGWSDL